jgi:dTDP-4-amino-4,6-dideoxygalactose transaminase
MAKIYVTQPSLPPLSEFNSHLEKIWESKWLTNNGEHHQSLERELARYLGVKHISIFSNGTIALITALKALGISGEVITTPFSFVATSHSLLWNNLIPVFADIDMLTCNIDPVSIEKAINEKTKAIMPVHCYGNPCDLDSIQKIAEKYNLKIIYDAAHAFGVKINNESILNFGDLSILSFHATKVFNTLEGGAVVCHTEDMKKKIDKLKNFGFLDEITIEECGINGKMNEIQAAFGLLNLKYLDENIKERKKIDNFYREGLGVIKGIKLFNLKNETSYNYSYFPILVDDLYPETRDELYFRLKEADIFSRRYFFPLISSMPMYKNFLSASVENLPNSNFIANKILCLPIYPGLSNEDQIRIIRSIKNTS